MKNLPLNFKSDILPHLIAVIVFLAVTLMFFRPVFFENQSLNQHDILQWEGGAKELLDYRDQTGEEGLWTNSMFGGMPGYLVNTRFSGMLLIHIEKVFTLFLASPVRIMFSSLLSFYILLLCFKVRPGLAIAGALLFGLSSYQTIGYTAGHNARIAAVAYMPMVLAGIHLAFSKKWIWGFILTMLGLALQIRVNHYQITYYLLLMVVIYGLITLIQAIKEKQLPDFAKTMGLLVVAVIIAVGCNVGRMWTIMEYSKYSIRGESDLSESTGDNMDIDGLNKSYAFKFSNAILEPMVLFIPNFMGGSIGEKLDEDSAVATAFKNNGLSGPQLSQQLKSLPTYFGPQTASAPYYAGAIAVFLFVLALFVADKKYKIWLAVCIVLSIMLSWGNSFTTFNYLIFDYLPGYNKFRSVTFTIIIAIVGINLLGFIGLEKFLSQDFTKKNQKILGMSLAITVGIGIITVFYSWIGKFSGPFDAQRFGAYDWLITALEKDRATMIRMDALRSIFFVLAAGALIYFYGLKKLEKTIFHSLIIFVALLDIGLVGYRYMNKEKFERNPRRQFFAENEADITIKKDTDLNYRVMYLPDPFNDARTSYHHKSIGGYHGAKLRRYQDLINRSIGPEVSALIQDFQSSGGSDMEKYGVLNMLNTKYFIAGPTANATIRNPDHNGNAWFVRRVEKAQNADEELQKVSEINTKTQAVIDVSRFQPSKEAYGVDGQIILNDYQPNKLTYKSNMNGDGLAVFSEIYYPKGWVATIDGNETPILRANYVLRALEIPAGNHDIVFEFKPRSYHVGNSIGFAFNILLTLILLAGIGYSVYSKSQSGIRED